MRLTVITVVLVVCHLLCGSSAYKQFQDSIPNGGRVPHPCLANFIWHGLGHKNADGGGPRNPFGTDFENNNLMWDLTLCQKDSDGDGRTNGEELGDPDCVWVKGQPPAQTTGLTHPGVCEPLDSPKCIERNDWDFCDKQQFDCPQVESPDVKEVTYKMIPTAVPPTETNYYCQLFDLESDRDHHIIGVKPALDNEYVIHHMLLFGCRDDPTNAIEMYRTPQPCGMQARGTCGQIIAGWSVGAVGDCNVAPAAVRIGKSTYNKALLQVHWNNPFKSPDYVDGSGLTLYYTPNLRPDDLGTFTLGQLGLRIPAGEMAYPEDSTCSSQCTRRILKSKVNVLSIRLHMHYLGAAAYVYQYRNGVKIATWASAPDYSYDKPEPATHWPTKDFEPGDELRMQCVFKSTSHTKATYYGDGTQNEMCFAFIDYYPVQNFELCLNMGTYELCNKEEDSLKSVDGCGFGRNNDPDEQLAYRELMTKCDTTGNTCTEQCQKLLTDNPHPCLTGNAKIAAEFFLPRTKGQQGEAIQTTFRSCDEVLYDNIELYEPNSGGSHTKLPLSVHFVVLALGMLTICVFRL